jgi:hypothetical protein
MPAIGVNNIQVLVRDTSTTTYHFGRTLPICEELVAGRGGPAESWTLPEAIAVPRRLCRRCALLVQEWTAAALSEASATDNVHPSR